MSISDSMRPYLGPYLIMITYTSPLHNNILSHKFLHNGFVLNTDDLSGFDNLLYSNIPTYFIFHMFSFRF